MMNGIEFANPEYLFLGILLIPMIVWYIMRYRRFVPNMEVSSLQQFNKRATSVRAKLRHLLFVFRVFAIIFLILALARPQSTNQWQNVTTEGIDIVLSLDISGSMLAEDFKPNRLEASKDVASEFINSRPDDRIGLVVFSGESFTQCPLTTDHAVLINFFDGIRSGMIEDGTAIGEGLATAVNRLKDSKSKSKVIILLTDGDNNAGAVAPETAAEIAKTYNIRVYTIGVGTIGKAPMPFQTPFGIQYQNVDVRIDEPLLREIASMTGGQYFRATNNDRLRDIYKEIDTLEKTKIAVKEYRKHKEEFFPVLLIAALLFIVELVLRNTVFRTIP